MLGSRVFRSARFKMIVFFLASGILKLVASKNPATTVLNEWPIIMAHDAATTYLKGGVLHQVNDWTKTQPDGGPSGLMDCGARAFDWRPSLTSEGSLIMHHGGIKVKHAMSDALDDMVNWAAKNPEVANLVFLMITDCEGSAKGISCTDAVKTELTSHNITYITDCSSLKGMTVTDAHHYAVLPRGGAILAVFDCWESYYDSSVACSGFTDAHDSNSSVKFKPHTTAKINAIAAANVTDAASRRSAYTCYEDSATKKYPLNHMWSYIDKTTVSGPPSDGRLWTTQCLWQETADSVVIGELHGSSLLSDEKRSTLNALVTARIQSGEINATRINFVEVNNVCDGGKELQSILQSL